MQKKKSKKSYFNRFWKLCKKEFGFSRYCELTGRRLITKGNLKYRYRGITLYLKEIIESGLSILLMLGFIVLFILFLIIIIKNYKISFTDAGLIAFAKVLYTFSKSVLFVAGSALILDSLLLITVLISSPGIDETIDSISVTIAGILLLIIGNIDYTDTAFIKDRYIFIKTILPLSLVVVLLIFSKHILRSITKKD